MNKLYLNLTLVAAMVASTGCLSIEKSDEIILEADGSVTWIVRETGVRSFDDDPAVVAREEATWLDAVLAGTEEEARMLRELGALDVRSELVRDRIPYEARHEARFSSLRELAETLTKDDVFGAPVEYLEDGRDHRLVLRVPVEDPEEFGKAYDSNDESMQRLRALRLVLADGIFGDDSDLAGFQRRDESANVVRPCRRDASEVEDGILTWELVWQTGPVDVNELK